MWQRAGGSPAPSAVVTAEATKPGLAGESARLLPLVALAVAIASLVAFGAVGRSFYDDFRLPQGSGMYHLLPEELAFDALFFAFGSLAVAGLWWSLRATRVPAQLVELAHRASRLGWGPPLGLCVAVAGLCVLIGAAVLNHAVISDDEHAYQFIAQTLRRGAVTAPSPGRDLDFFREQFVVITPSARFGKYPLGHPLALAAGQALGLESLVVPVLTGALGAAVYAIGRTVGGPGTGLLSTALFASSPQVLLTGATLLSQPTAAVCLCAAIVSLLQAERGARLAWLAAAGAALGFGVLVRPLPIVLFVPVAAVYALGRPPFALVAAARRLAALGLPVAVAVLVMLVVNRAQVGNPFVTAYGESLAGGRGPEAILLTTSATLSMRAMSVVGSLIRLNFWMLGWPLSILLCLFARWSRSTALLWGMVAASLAYRLVTPKVGVGGAGPIYFFEVVPLLCVLTADAVVRMVRAPGPRLFSGSSMAALVLAAGIVNGSLFLPSRLADLRRMAAAQDVVNEMIRERGLRQALVFHESVVPWWTRRSWAYYPRINSPDLDDDVLFVLLQRAHGLEENVEFWKRRYPARTAWYFGYVEGRPELLPLERFVSGASTPPSAVAASPAPSAAPP